jgi:hypothetical protein
LLNIVALAMLFLQARARAREVWELPEVNGYFDDEDHFKAIKGLCSYTHPMLPGAMFGNLGSLKRKLQEQHKLHFCDLCIKGRKVRLFSSVVLGSCQGCWRSSGVVAGAAQAALLRPVHQGPQGAAAWQCYFGYCSVVRGSGAGP